MLEWVIEAAKESANYLSRPNMPRLISTSVYLLIPEGDKIGPAFHNKAQMVDGPEFDVLARYKKLLDLTTADYVVRITGDCALIPPPVITKAVNVAVFNGIDYVSNVDQRLRLSFDGMDVEVMSARLLNYMAEKAWTKEDREHVTTFARGPKMPKEFKTAHIIGYLDMSGLKLSVDTPEDLENVIRHKARVLEALKISKEISGDGSTHRF